MPDDNGPRPGEDPRLFASEFPERFSAAVRRAKGALDGIGALSGNGHRQDGVLDAASLSVYHEIYRVRIELELESAAILWRAAEVTWALRDTIEAVSRVRNGGQMSVPAESAAGRRPRLVSQPPFSEPQNGSGHPAELVQKTPQNGNGRGPDEKPPADPHHAYRLWARAMEERRNPPRRRRFLPRRRKKVAVASSRYSV